MTDPLRGRALHVAGHATLALAAGIDPEILSIEDRDRFAIPREGGRFIDRGVMLHIPDHWPAGPYSRSRLAETLVRISLAGCGAERVHCSQPCTIDAIEENEVDWRLAWNTAGVLWADEQARIEYLLLEVQRLERFLQHDEFLAVVAQLARALREHGTLKWMQVMDIYEEATCCEERSTELRNPWKPPRRWE